MAEKRSRREAEVINHPPGCMNPKGPLLTLVVGPERKIITTRRELLIRHSEVFRNALAGPWAEATASALELPDSDPEIVENFIIWARSGLMLGPKFALELYVWADKYQVLLLKTDAAHTLYRHWTMWKRRTRTQRIAPAVIPDAKIIHFALDNLPQNDRIIQLIRVVHALWECRLSDRRNTRAMRSARARLLSTTPYGPTDRIGPAHTYHAAGNKNKGAILGCPHAFTSQTNIKACFNCLWLAQVKPWLMNGAL